MSMDYDGRFIMQKAVDWSLLRSTSDCLLLKGRKNDGMTIPVSACVLLNYRIIHKNDPHFNRKKFQLHFSYGEG